MQQPKRCVLQALILGLAATLLVACGGGGGSGSSSSASSSFSVSGAGVKGPMANAAVTIYQLDLNAADLRGTTLASGSTNAQAQLSGVTLSSDASGLLLIEFNSTDDTIDLTSGVAPIYSQLLTVRDAQSLSATDDVYATPLTTMAVQLAQEKADQGAPYAGNGDGSISQEEFNAALEIAQNQVKATLGFGIDQTLDIFTIPPLVTDDSTTESDLAATASYRMANEALAAITVDVADDAGTDGTPEEVLNALVEDLTDGALDGRDSDGVVELLDELQTPIDQTLTNTDPSTLMIPGTDQRVGDIERVLVEEKEDTGINTDTLVLEDGTVTVEPEPAETVSDMDNDGVSDMDDAFPTDPNESVDTDGDGVGDQGDAFPEDPEETRDSDGDQVGDNADLFPNDPTESADRDNDGVGDNGDAFPDDASESQDTDGDQVGDNGDAFPNDPTETRDTDQDGVGDNGDAFPEDPNETSDRDQDGVGDVADVYPDDPERSRLNEIVASYWIGANDTRVEFEAPAGTTEYYRFHNADCDTNEYSTCDGGALDLLTGQDVIDQSTTTTQAALHQFHNAGRVAELDLGTKRWSRRYGHGIIEFKNRVWVLGGYDGVYEGPEDDGQNSDDQTNSENDNDNTLPDEFDGWRANDVWSSQDGDVWVEHINKAPWDARHNHAVAVFQDKLWVIGGDTLDSTFMADVWSSEDGLNWTQITDSAPFGGRQLHRALTFDNKLWVIGGTTEGFQYTNDVWYTEDGQNWVQATDSAPWPALGYVGAVVFNNAMWIIGGGGLYGGVWHSIDGQNWTNEAETNYPARNVYGIAVHDNKVWIAGGYSNGGDRNDLWYTSDGITFTKAERADGHYWFPRTRPGLVGFNNRLWVMGGDSNRKSDIHSTFDGVTWRWHSFGATDLPQRTGHEFIAFNNALYSFGGGSYHVNNAIWRTTDGVDWSEVLAEAPFARRSDQAAAVFNNRLFVIGGFRNDGTGRGSDIWSTADGMNWQQDRESADFSPRSDHQVAVWQGKLWLVGGNVDGDLQTDVWSSSDGVNWSNETEDAGFPARRSFSLVAYGDQLMMISGYDFPDVMTDVWSTTDGITWVQETNELPVDDLSSTDYTAIVKDDQILLVGGNSSDRSDLHIISSTDGVNWTRIVEDTGIPTRTGFGLAVKDGLLWLHGGGWQDGLAYIQSDTWRSDNLEEWRVGLKRASQFDDNQ
ncbi:MAG: hypothetical protein AAF541_06395 [Pseudomonadota bacterium]